MKTTASAVIAASVLALTVAVRPLEAQYPGEVRVPRSVLERYVGEYVYPTGSTVNVRLRGDTLFRELPGQLVPFEPISPTVFRLGPVFTAEFVIDEAGGVTQILTDGVAVEYRLRRRVPGASTSTVAAPMPAIPAVRVPRAVLERYVGTYEFVPGQMSRTDLMVVVRLRGDSLTRQVSGQPETVLEAISPTRFRVAGTSLTTEFVLEQGGGVTQVMGVGSQRMTASRTATP